MSEAIRVESMMHKGEKRIKLELPYRHDYIERVKQLTGRKWSQSKKCWHLPYNKASFEQLKAIFVDVEIILPDGHQHQKVRKSQVAVEQQEVKTFKTPEAPSIQDTQQSQSQQQGQVRLVITAKKLFVQINKQESDLRFLRSVHYARWNANTFLWEITNSKTNLQLLRGYFTDRLTEQVLSSPESIIANKKQQYKLKELTVAVKEGRLRLLFAYDKKLIAFIKQLPYPKYDDKNRWWSIADTPVVRADIEKFCQDYDWKMSFSEARPAADRKAKISKEEVLNYRSCPEAMIDQLHLKRYSQSTIRTYKSMFEEFINYYPTLVPEEITEKEIIVFLRYLVEERQVSTSYQNQAGPRRLSMPSSSITSKY